MKNREYIMDLKTDPQVAHPGQEVFLILTTWINNDEREYVVLEAEHEQKVHLIIVSEDLSYFDHLHPMETVQRYTVKTKFPFGGRFFLFADYVPEDAEHVVNKLEVDVSGDAPAPQAYSKEKLTGSAEDYSISLISDQGKFTTGHMMIHGVLKRDGREIDPSTLDDYLGAKAHVVLISVDDKEYIHVHPQVENGRYRLHTSFPKTGIYRGWIQFQVKGNLHTTDYVIKVNVEQNNPENEHLKTRHHQ